MFKNAFVPYGGYWSSPFCRWQESLQNENAVRCGAAMARKFFESNGIDPMIFDGLVLGTTVPQKQWFFGPPQFASHMGNENISGPLMAQACATSAVSMNYAAKLVEMGTNRNVFVATTDRCSNAPISYGPTRLDWEESLILKAGWRMVLKRTRSQASQRSRPVRMSPRNMA